MGWYKKAQASQQNGWWDQFYHHMTNTADFILQDAGITVDAHKNSINDGQRANFTMKASYGGEQYTIRIQLQFSERLNNLQFGPMGTGRLEGIPQPAENIVGATVYVISGSPGIVDIVGEQSFEPWQVDPDILMTSARDAILNDARLEENQPFSDYDPTEQNYQ